MRFYTVKINGKEYAAQGRGRQQLATRLKIPFEDVTIGADLFSLQEVPDDYLHYIDSLVGEPKRTTQ